MELTNKIIELLSQYIDENKKLKEKFNKQRTNQTLYEDLIKLLETNPNEERFSISLLINIIYVNHIYEDEFYRIVDYF